ncbi:MAG: hypothetical protein ACOZAN_00435 [Patescibacteria group bacterium]
MLNTIERITKRNRGIRSFRRSGAERPNPDVSSGTLAAYLLLEFLSRETANKSTIPSVDKTITSIEQQLNTLEIEIPEALDIDGSNELAYHYLRTLKVAQYLDGGLDTRNTPSQIYTTATRLNLEQQLANLPDGVANAFTNPAFILRQELASMGLHGFDIYCDAIINGPLVSNATETRILHKIREANPELIGKELNRLSKLIKKLSLLTYDAGSTTGNSIHQDSQTFSNLEKWTMFLQRLERIENENQRRIAARIVMETVRQQTALTRADGLGLAFDSVFGISGTHFMYFMVNGDQEGVLCQPAASGSTVGDAARGKKLGGGVGSCANLPENKNPCTKVDVTIVPSRKEDGSALSFEEYRFLQIKSLVEGLEKSLKISETTNNPPQFSHLVAIPPKCGLVYKQAEELLNSFDLNYLLESSTLTNKAQKAIITKFLEKQGKFLLIIDAAQERWLVDPAKVLQLFENKGIATVWMSTLSKSIGAAKLAGLFYFNSQATELVAERISRATREEILNIIRYYAVGFLSPALEQAVMQRIETLNAQPNAEKIPTELAINFNQAAKVLASTETLAEFRAANKHDIDQEGELQASINWLRNITSASIKDHLQIKLVDDQDASPSMIQSFLIKDLLGEPFSSTMLKRLRVMLRTGVAFNENSSKLEFFATKTFCGNPFDDITATPKRDENGNLLDVAINKTKHVPFLRFGPRAELIMTISKLLNEKQRLEAIEQKTEDDLVQLNAAQTQLIIIEKLWQENIDRLRNVVEYYHLLATKLYQDGTSNRLVVK